MNENKVNLLESVWRFQFTSILLLFFTVFDAVLTPLMFKASAFDNIPERVKHIYISILNTLDANSTTRLLQGIISQWCLSIYIYIYIYVYIYIYIYMCVCIEMWSFQTIKLTKRQIKFTSTTLMLNNKWISFRYH